jgi:iron complex transport system ATP-binding protein
MIEIKHLHIGYSSSLLSIDELNLQAGKVYALIGANGKGKTTFLKTLNGLLKPLSGQLSINQKSILQMNQEEFSRTISFVSSKFDGIEHLTVFNYVALGRIPYLGLFGRLLTADQHAVTSALKLVGFEHFSDRLTNELSDGERQMISIARALAQETPIITLDEPTAFLDYANRKKLLSILKEIARTTNKCVVISSHDIELCLSQEVQILQINKQNKLSDIAHGKLEDIINNCFDL